VETSVRKPRGRPRRALPQPGEIVESLQDQIRKSLAMTTTVSTLPRSLDPELEEEPASRAESIEPIESIDGGDDRTPAGVESDEEFGEDWKQTGENLRKLASDKTQLEERKTEAIQKQKDNNFDLWFAKEKQSFAQDRLRALEQELKDGEDDLERLERERQESVLELKKVEKEAKMLSVEITLAKNKRKRAELEREERQAKKQKQALETEVEEE
jgi:chromosome segregation ATPase